LIRVAEAFPSNFTSLEDLFDLFSEFLRPLPITQFKQIILQIHLSPELQAALLADLALPFLVSIPTGLKVLNLSQSDLIKYFLSQRANSIQATENAKFSFLIENLLSNFYERGLLTFSPELLMAIRKGIQARREHAVGDGRRKSKGSALEIGGGREELKRSSDRIHWFVELAQCKLSYHGYFIKVLTVS
jgi:hypothetical protein